jgi:hypothetical protein
MHDYIIGIDPGNVESAFCLINARTMQPVYFNKEKNADMWRDVFMAAEKIGWNVDFAVEMIASYGMPVGRGVFDTCVWIGQMKDRIEGAGMECNFVYRKEEKRVLCNNLTASDSSIRHALIDRFAPGVKNLGKGNKAKPGWFYGFRADIWQAYAVAVTYADMKAR